MTLVMVSMTQLNVSFANTRKTLESTRETYFLGKSSGLLKKLCINQGFMRMLLILMDQKIKSLKK